MCFHLYNKRGTNVSEIFLLLVHVGRLLNVRTDCAGSWRDFFSYLISELFGTLSDILLFRGGGSCENTDRMIPSHHIFVPKSIFNRLIKPHLKQYFALDRNFNFVDAKQFENEYFSNILFCSLWCFCE